MVLSSFAKINNITCLKAHVASIVLWYKLWHTSNRDRFKQQFYVVVCYLHMTDNNSDDARSFFDTWSLSFDQLFWVHVQSSAGVWAEHPSRCQAAVLWDEIGLDTGTAHTHTHLISVRQTIGCSLDSRGKRTKWRQRVAMLMLFDFVSPLFSAVIKSITLSSGSLSHFLGVALSFHFF